MIAECMKVKKDVSEGVAVVAMACAIRNPSDIVGEVCSRNLHRAMIAGLEIPIVSTRFNF
jgi:hypothetical protein